MSFSPGTRVRVAIKDRSEYARGCAEALDGKTGTVEVSKGDGDLLVLFDTPAPTWHTNQTPARSFWFPPKDLRPEGSP